MDRQHKISQQELVEAQRKVDAARLEELQRVAEAQSRPMTALEKFRMQKMQSMIAMEKQHEAGWQKTDLLDTPFMTLLGGRSCMEAAPINSSTTNRHRFTFLSFSRSVGCSRSDGFHISVFISIHNRVGLCMLVMTKKKPCRPSPISTSLFLLTRANS